MKIGRPQLVGKAQIIATGARIHCYINIFSTHRYLTHLCGEGAINAFFLLLKNGDHCFPKLLYCSYQL